ncbi:hypothetical protein KI655_18750 [Vibrio sp. D404a]|uniref:hypothetical protein n=1 Tax=unclassified Vibrio TaxID=2614977 RepID=UPI00255445F3|nr:MULTISPECIES: hypothetical protein [unclassified Vibrio]MDK9739338.1 hypothetical protein [Vibrio sp. D404a]MDK9797627.1 hypothetical protein [Vibrio sp. D449a]
MKYEVNTLNKRDDLEFEVASLDDRSWPLFLQNGDAKSWQHFYDELSEYVLVLTQEEQLIAVGFTVPVIWDGNADNLPSSIEEVLLNGLKVKRNNLAPNTLIPIGALVDNKVQGQGLSSKVLVEMKKLATSLDISSLVVPVRPTKKAQYPLQSIHDYATWKNGDGYLYDPWLRVHEKLGAEIIKIAECTLEVTNSIENWESWTKMVFPVSGEYIVKGALSSVRVDKNKDTATYLEPNVWMLHPMDT